MVGSEAHLQGVDYLHVSVSAPSPFSSPPSPVQPCAVTNDGSSPRATFVVFSGEWDRLMAAFTMATGAAACGMDVTMFFTFWGVAFLKTNHRRARASLMERAFGAFLRGGAGHAPLSRLHMGGIGRWLMTREMRRKNLTSLPQLVDLARESGVRFAVCHSSMAMLGIAPAQLPADMPIEVCGVAHLWDRAGNGQVVFV